MKQIILYAMIFMAVVLPTLFFTVLSDDKRKKKVKEEKSLPPLLQFSRPPAVFFELLGFGTLFRKLFPEHTRSVQQKLDFAGLRISPGTFYCMQMFMFIFSALLAAGITGMSVDEENRISIPIAGLIAAFVGGSLPGILVGNLAQERQMQILRAIPYSIDLIASAMRGGLDFSAAIRFYVNLGIRSPLVDEYSRMLREMELGVIRTTALQNMAERIKIKEFTSFASAVALGTELGAPLTETMEIQGDEMRKARFALAETKAQRAPSLMLLPMALFILPAVFITILTPVFLKMKEAGVPLF